MSATRPMCDAHPDVPMVATCRRCNTKLCAACRHGDGMFALCASCHRSARRGPWVRLAIAVPLLGALGVGGWYGYKNLTPAFDYGLALPKVRQLEARLAAEPCNHEGIEQLASVMLGAGDGRGALARVAAFEQKCGAHLPLKKVTYLAHSRLGEHEAAVADVTALVASEPDNASYLAWRGVLYQEQHDDARAIADFEKVLQLAPNLSDVPLNLANVYERSGRPCDALKPLDQLVVNYPDRRWTGQIEARIQELTKKGNCARATAEPGVVTIRTPPGQHTIRADVKINGVEAGSFIVDTGASVVVLTRAAAENAGVSLAGARKARAQTANGVREALAVTVQSVEVKGLVAKRVEAHVVDDLGPGIDGLLGMTYLSRFDIKKDAGTLEIRERGAKPAASATP